MPEEWRSCGRRAFLGDGATISLPDTESNQACYPQPPAQNPGLGFPLVRLVVLFSLVTGLLHEVAMGPYSGKETGETALLRELLGRLQAGDVLVAETNGPVRPDDARRDGWLAVTGGPNPYRRVRTDARGALDLDGASAPQGTVRLSAHPDPAKGEASRGYLRSAIVATPAGATDVRVRLSRGVFVEGTVVDAAGLAVQEGEVQAVLTWPDSMDRRGFESARVDREGRFRLGPVAPGPAVLFYQPPMARPRWAGSGELSVVAPRADVVVVVHPTAVLHGRVAGGSRQGIARWNPAEGNPAPQAPLDADGRFTLPGIPPRPGLLYITDGADIRPALLDRVIPGDAPLALFWSDGAAIEGRVVGLPAETIVGVEAVAGAFTAGASTSVDGTFRIRALPPGRYRLRLVGSYRGGADDVATGTSGVVLTATAR